MTIFFHDVSNWNGDYHPDGPCIAKATEGTGYTDPRFVTNRDRTLAGGWPFLAYHYLHHGDIHDQVMHAESVVGAGQPLMLDVEIVEIDGVRLPDPTLTDTFDFMAMWPGLVSLAYIPRWFWQSVWGSPSLTGITDRGAGLISSSYTTYSDTGVGWAPYGGVWPSVWQYTSTPLDSNAYKGTVDQLRRLFAEGVNDMTPDEVKAAVKAAMWELANSVTNPLTATDRAYRNDLWARQLSADGFANDAGATPVAGVLKARLDTIEAKIDALAVAANVDHTHTVTVTGAGGTGPAQPLDPSP
jgi:hypothetical protein